MIYAAAVYTSNIMKNNLLDDRLRYKGDDKSPTFLRLLAYDATGAERFADNDFEKLKPHLRENKVNWIHVRGLQDVPTIQNVCGHFGVDFLVAQDILNTAHLTKIEQLDDCNLVIVKLLSSTDSDGYESSQFSVIQGRDFLLTFSEREIDFLEDIGTAIDKDVLKVRRRGTDFLMSVILNSVMTDYVSILASMEDQLENLEESLLERLGSDESGIGDIQKYRRDYRVIRKAVAPLKDRFNALMHSSNGLITEECIPFYRDVNDHLQSVFQSLESCRDAISALTDLYLSNNDQRMNNIMKQLTVVSTLFIPLTFFAGVWGMNFKNMPELELEHGYLIAWGVMLLVVVIVFFYFRRRKWY